MKRILACSTAALVVALGVGGCVFMHPTMPPLREPYTATQQPIDDRVGVYTDPRDERPWLIVPALTSGYYQASLDRWSGVTKRTPEELAAEPLVRLAEQPYALREIHCEASVPLVAWLFEPAVAADTGLVILHGAGDSSRANGWYLYLAHTLASAGYVVVLPDKRGSGRSGGDWREESLDVLAQDGADWLAELRRQRPGLERVGFFGVSQGGMIAPDAARRGRADFVVATSAVTLPLREQLPVEVGNDIADAGAPEALRPLLTRIYTRRAMNRYARFWELNGDYDMVAQWERWRGPMYLALGEDDEFQYVPVKASVRRLERDYPNEGNLQWRVYRDVRHSLAYDSGPHQGEFQRAHLADLWHWLQDYRLASPADGPVGD